MQPSVQAVYDHVAAWSGETLTEATASRLASWPWEHLAEFADQWPTPEGRDLDCEIEPVHLGRLRAVTSLGGGQAAARRQKLASLLLYAPEIVTPADDLVQGWYISGDDDTNRARQELQDQLAWLAKIRPLVESGEITFSRRLPGDEWAAFFDNLNPDVQRRFRLLDDMSRTDWEKGGWDWPRAISDEELFWVNRSVAIQLGTSLELVARGAGQAFSLEPVEEIAFARVLGGKRLTDGRVTTLERLGDFALPDFQTDFSTLLALRRSDTWERWREALRVGVTVATDVPDTEDGAREASKILLDHVATQLLEIDGEARKSKVLTAARRGTKGFVVSGLGAVSSAVVTGDPASLVAGVAPAIADPAAEYLAQLFPRRKNRAVLDVLMALHNVVA